MDECNDPDYEGEEWKGEHKFNDLKEYDKKDYNVVLISTNDDIVSCVVMNYDTFASVWKCLESIDMLHSDGRKVTKQELAEIRADGRIPMIRKSGAMVPLFKAFNILTSRMTGAVRSEPYTG